MADSLADFVEIWALFADFSLPTFSFLLGELNYGLV
jgi:hypothetical protein